MGRKILVGILTVLLLVSSSQSAYAQKTASLAVEQGEDAPIVLNLEERGCSVSGNQNETTIYNWLIETMKCNSATACGILANIRAECNFNPRAQGKSSNGSISYGLCQWTGSRFEALKAYCKKKKLSYETVAGQLAYLKYELETTEQDAWSHMQGISNNGGGAYTAAYNWAKYFERCPSKYYEERAVAARDTYWAYYGGYSIVYGDNINLGKSFYAYIVNASMGNYITNDGTNVSSRSRSSAIAKQMWKFERQSDGSYKISSMSGGKVLEAKNFGTKDGTNVQVAPGTNDLNQRWYLYGSSGAYQFGGAYGNLYLDVNACSSTEGTNVQMWTGDKTDAQKFRIQKVKTYAVQYEANGGSGAPADQEKVDGIPLTLSRQVPTRSGYLFAGWSTNRTSSTASFQPGSSLTADKTTVLYAVWKPAKTLTAGTGIDEEIRSGEYRLYQFTSPKDGVYVFHTTGSTDTYGRLYSDSMLKNQLSNDDNAGTGNNFRIAYSMSAGETVYLRVSGSGTAYGEYKVRASLRSLIRYHANGGTGAPASQEKLQGTALQLSRSVPTREGYSFLGWSSDKTAVTAEYRAGGWLSVNENMTLYAVWKKK